MANYNEIYTNKYGTSEMMTLRALGGDPDAIIANYPAPGGWTFDGLFGAYIPDDADSIHQLIVSEIERLYFASISRESAVAICNALSLGLGLGTIRISDNIDRIYNNYTFMTAWNANHPEADKIIPPAALEI